MNRVQKAVEAAIKKHKGLRAAARATGLDPGYLCRLRKGKHPNAGDAILKAIGLEKRVTYRNADV